MDNLDIVAVFRHAFSDPLDMNAMIKISEARCSVVWIGCPILPAREFCMFGTVTIFGVPVNSIQFSSSVAPDAVESSQTLRSSSFHPLIFLVETRILIDGHTIFSSSHSDVIESIGV